MFYKSFCFWEGKVYWQTIYCIKFDIDRYLIEFNVNLWQKTRTEGINADIFVQMHVNNKNTIKKPRQEQ